MQPLNQEESFFLDEPIEQSQIQPTGEIGDAQESSDFFLDEPIDVGQPEGIASFAGRQVLRSGSRAAETLLGLPGDVSNFIGNVIATPIRYLTGAKELTPEQLESKRKLQSRILPTSQQFKEVSEQVTGGFTSPQSRAERVSDEIVSDFASLALPVKGKVPFARAIGTSLFSNLGAESIRELGGGDTGAAASKFGLMVTAGLIGRPNAKQLSRDLYKQSVGAIPEEAAISTKNMQPQISKLQKELLKGGTSPQKTPATNLLKELNSKITDGKIPVQELPAFRQSINDYRFDRTLGDRARYFLDRFEDVVQEGLKDYGQVNPEFAKVYRDANLAHAGLKQSNKIATNISKRIKIDRLDPHTISLLGHGAIGGFAGSGLGALPSLLGAASAALGYRTLSRLKNPVLRKHYESLLKAAAKDNAAGIIRNANLLDKAIRKDVLENPEEANDSLFQD